MKKIFSSALFPPVHYFSHLATTDEALIDVHCNYSRQTYRNRYVIYGANGVLPLSVPVVKMSGKKIVTKDIRVSYDTPWNEVHWKSIEAAYNSSPFYIFYKDDFAPIFNKKWKYLIDMNMTALEQALNCIDMTIQLSLTDKFEPEYSDSLDLREIIHPKKRFDSDSMFKPQPYRQVFGVGKKFEPNLSILDLLFNKGPESLIVLENSIKNI